MTGGEAALRVRAVRFDAPDFARCEAIRRAVFVAEQGVTEAEEMDGLDVDCAHFLAERGEDALGTARLREVDGAAKAERVAVVAAARRGGVGRRLMDALEAEARRRGHGEVKLAAQTSAIPFYERLGYACFGDPFVEARIPHRWMRKPL